MNKPLSKLSLLERKTIQEMIRYEQNFAKLYAKYAGLFDNHAFWMELRQEELQHAGWIEALAQSQDVLTVNDKTLPLKFIQALNFNIEKEISSPESINVIEALKRSIMYEKTFLEKNYFEIFSGCKSTFQETMERLRIETNLHISKVENEIQRISNKEESYE